MLKLIWPALLLLMASACTVVSHKEEGDRLTAAEKQKVDKKLSYLEGQIAASDIKIVNARDKAEESRRQIDAIRREREDLSKEIEARLEAAEKLMEQAKELTRKLRPPTEEEEVAAERLLLVAKCFQRDNPTEDNSVIAAKYKVVFERYPKTKAAKEASKTYDRFPK